MPEVNMLTIVVQGGSFALVAAMNLAAVFYLFPKAIDRFTKQGEDFKLAINALAALHDLRIEKRDAAQQKMAESVQALADKLADVECVAPRRH